MTQALAVFMILASLTIARPVLSYLVDLVAKGLGLLSS